jgi:hypothetical protein
MEQQTLETQFKEMTGRHAVNELIEHLTEATNRLPAFAMVATTDAVNVLSRLVRSHTNASEEHIEDACSLVASALFNSLTNYEVQVMYEDDDNENDGDDED